MIILKDYSLARVDLNFQYWSNGLFNIAYLVVIAGDAVCKAMQGIANDRPGIAQGLFKNREKSIGATGCEPATQCSQRTRKNEAITETYFAIRTFREITMV